ncbi:MAG TPA: replication-associated recombination protein A [Victivallales bacterium]|nr:replication-associated recombination protein A [Victivallales bacterium]
MDQNLFENLEGHTVDAFSAEGADCGSSTSLPIPLAARLRPMSFSQFFGQKHIIAEDKLLRRAIESDSFHSIILSGPPGSGKTSLAELIATVTGSVFVRLSGVISSVSDLRKEIAAADLRRRNGRRTIIFIDEIHRFNRAQQDVLLPDIEKGTIRFIGATTQNPFFYVVGPLLSRSLLFKLEALSKEDISEIISSALSDERAFPRLRIEISDDAVEFIATNCEGDARRALNALEIAVMTGKKAGETVTISKADAESSMQEKAIEYGDDGHYDTASAFIKSMRGSDPDSAVYWLAKMLHAGEDIMFIARRIVIFASEDIGNADPRALEIAVSAMKAVEMIGMPEARIILSQAVTYCASSPKSNASYVAIDAAMSDIKEGRVQPVPTHLRDSHYKGAAKLGHGEGYKYPHDFKGASVDQDYMCVKKIYYNPSERGHEAKIKAWLDASRSHKEAHS